jgi:ParB family chromosome partitioning protein
MRIALDLIQPSPSPVRTTWDEDKMGELAQSIREQGIIVPVKVRPIAGNGHYELVYGHRRVEAARRAGLGEIEAIVEGADDDAAMWQAIIENVQRENLTAMELAEVCQERRQAGYTNAEIAARLGWKHPDHVKGYMAMINAPDVVRGVMEKNSGLLGHKDFGATSALHQSPELRAAVLEKAANENLSARQAFAVANAVAAAPSPEAKNRLLEWEYSPVIHDPDNIRERAKEYGAHDALYHNDTPSKQQQWDQTPEIKAIVNSVLEAARLWTNLIKTTRNMSEVGKMAPESRQFIAEKARRLAATLTDWANELEASNGQ